LIKYAQQDAELQNKLQKEVLDNSIDQRRGLVMLRDPTVLHSHGNVLLRINLAFQMIDEIGVVWESPQLFGQLEATWLNLMTY
jgi:hypothetical protein